MAVISTYSYTGNGSNRTFTVTENILSESHVVVWIDGSQLPSTAWDLLGREVVLSAAPSSGSEIYIYASDDGTFPEGYQEASAITQIYNNLTEILLANDSAAEAAASATEASNSATESAVYAANASASEFNAAASATAASLSEIGASESNISAIAASSSAANSALSASSDAIAADQSASDALASQVAAALSESHAATSEVNAENYYNSMAQYADSANLIADHLTEIGAVSGSIENVNLVGGNLSLDWEYITDAGSIADAVTNMTGTSSINTVADNISNVNTVAGISTDISTVVGMATDIDEVLLNMTDIQDAPTAAAAAASSASSALQYSQNAFNSESNAEAYKNSAASSASSASSNASAASSSAATASIHASTAATQAGIALSNATSSANSASDAYDSAQAASASAISSAGYASSALAAKNAAETAYDNFDDRYLGSKSESPTVDNDGDSLVEGALYWNTTIKKLHVYDGSSWVVAAVSLSTIDTDAISEGSSNLYYTDSRARIAVGDLGNDLTGFPNLVDSEIAFDQVSRELTLSPTGSSFVVYHRGEEITISETLSLTITNTTGGRYIRYNYDTGLLEESTINGVPSIINDVLVAYIFWESTAQKALIFGEERHSLGRDTQWHLSQHLDVGCVWRSGGAMSYTLSNDDATIGIATPLVVADEDLIHTIIHSASPANYYEQTLNGDAAIPAIYQVGTVPTQSTPTTVPWVKGTSTIYYNPITTGSGSLTECPNNQYVSYYIIATNDTKYPVKAIMGHHTHTNLASAELEEFDSFGFSVPELVPMYKVILRASSSATYGCQITAVYTLIGRQATATSGFTASSHENLTERSNPDQHPIAAITGLQTALDGKVDDSQVLTNVPSGALFTDTTYTSLSEFTNDVGYITDYTVTEADVTAHQSALSIDVSQVSGITGFSGAYEDLIGAPTNVSSFTNDSGYLTSYTETDPIYTASSWYTTTNNAANWNTAYGWGNHASAGYLTSVPAGYVDFSTNLAIDLGGL